MASHHSPTFNDDEIDQFCAVTGASKDIGQHFIEACGGDMQAAVEMYLDSGSSTSTKYSRPGIHEHQNDDAGEGTSFQKNNHFNNGEVRAPIPQKKERLVEEGHSYYANARRRARPESVFDSFRNFHDETTEHSSEDASQGRRKTLEQLFRPPIDLIFKGSFRAAMEYGATKNKWLIVNVQNVKEFSCQVLNRDVWSNSKVKELIKKRFIFWQVYSDSYEGNWYMQFYKVSSWPQVAFLDPRTGEKMLECNKIDADSFYQLAEEFLEINDTPNETPFNPAPSKRIKHSDDILEASEEKQVEAAIKASMLKASMASWAGTPVNYETDESDQDDDDDHESKSLEVSSFIPESSQASTSEHLPHTAYLGASSDAKTKIVLRLPNGERRMLEWPCSSKLKALVAYVEENGHMGEEFQLVTNFPRRVIDTADSSQVTLVDSHLHPQETVFVHLP